MVKLNYSIGRTKKKILGIIQWYSTRQERQERREFGNNNIYNSKWRSSLFTISLFRLGVKKGRVGVKVTSRYVQKPFFTQSMVVPYLSSIITTIYKIKPVKCELEAHRGSRTIIEKAKPSKSIFLPNCKLNFVFQVDC